MPARQPQECHTEWLKAFNAGDLDQMMTFYEPDCVFVPQPGHRVTGTDAVRQALEGFLALKGTMELCVREVLQNDGVALLIAEWTLAGTGSDGRPVSLAGTTSDVVRRQADGTWRFAIDNPLGVQAA